MSEYNIHPIHKNFRSLGSNSTHTSTFSPYDESTKGFQNFTTLGSNSTHGSSRESGFQYVQSLITLQTVSASGEVNNVLDQVIIKYTILCDEVVNSFDAVGSGRPRPTELVNVLDESVVKIIKWFEETVNVTDLIAKETSFESTNNVLDQVVVKIKVLCSEVLSVLETSDAYMRTDVTDSVKIMISKAIHVTDTVRIGISGNLDVTDSVNIGIFPETFAGVTGASGFTSVTPISPIVIDPHNPLPTALPVPGQVTPIVIPNPWEPTIIIGGVVISRYDSTAPPGY